MERQMAGESNNQNLDPWQLLSMAEAARRLGLCRRSVEIRASRGELKTVKLGRRRLVRVRDLHGYIQKSLQ